MMPPMRRAVLPVILTLLGVCALVGCIYIPTPPILPKGEKDFRDKVGTSPNWSTTPAISNANAPAPAQGGLRRTQGTGPAWRADRSRIRDTVRAAVGASARRSRGFAKPAVRAGPGQASTMGRSRA